MQLNETALAPSCSFISLMEWTAASPHHRLLMDTERGVTLRLEAGDELSRDLTHKHPLLIESSVYEYKWPSAWRKREEEVE